jgi:hypothetical protein
MNVDSVACAQCGGAIDERPDDRRPCPSCGSLTRAITASGSASIKFETHIGTRVRQPGGWRWRRQVDSGDSFHRKTGIWNLLHRSMDRDADWYDEVVTDSEGNVIHEVHEPLSDHQGHGDARPRDQ